MTEPLLTIDDLQVTYRTRFGRTGFQALKGVSLDIRPGETVGLVGESGSGKTTVGRAILGLAPVTEGSIAFQGEDISHATRKDRKRLAQDIQVVFQDPYTSLNPNLTIERSLTEPLIGRMSSRAASARVKDLLRNVGLPADAASRLPKQFSGGQRQRVAIARALALDPKLIICDEPVSALDLSTQERVMELLLEIQKRTGVAYLFISHDLNVVRALSHRVAVLFRGEIVERGEAAVVTATPEHPYTQRLLLASPVADPKAQRERRAQRQLLSSQTAHA